MTQTNCPCGRDIPFEKCCKPIIEGRIPAKTSEDLMRSRYTAFTLSDGDYLMKSHHSRTRKLGDKKNIESWAKSMSWIKLEVLNSTRGQKTDDFGTVEFKAFYFERGRIEVIHENSEFTKENSEWKYVGLATE